MDSEQFKEAAHAAIDHIISYFKALPSLRVTPSISPGYLRPQMPDSAPTEPSSFKSLIPSIDSKIIPGLTHWQSPNFMAFFPATTSYPSILAELYSAAFTAPAFNWLCSPACTELETVVLDWIARACGLSEVFLSDGPTGGGGVIQGSASEAIVTVMIAAREAWVRAQLKDEGLLEGEGAERDQQREDRAAEIRSKLVAVGSECAHSATQKAANILGVRYRSVPAPQSTGFVMTAAALKAKLDECKAQGLEPFYVTATLGTTATCAVDDLEGIANIRKAWPHPLWVHVDAAYAGAALLCPEYRELAQAQFLGEMDSFNFNMHKWLLVNFDTSCLYIRDRRPLTTALSITPSYLQNPTALSGLVTDYRDWQIPLGRRFRSLKIWFVLHCYGLGGLQRVVRNGVAQGELFAGLVKGERGRRLLEVVSGPAFALTVVRCRDPSGGVNGVREEGRREDEVNGFEGRGVTEEGNALTRQVVDLINSRGEVFLTGAVVGGVQAIRVVSANERADEAHVRRAFEILCDTTEEVRAATGTD